MSKSFQVLIPLPTVERARRVAALLDHQEDAAGHRRIPCHADAIRAATAIGLTELERRFGLTRADSRQRVQSRRG